MFFKPRLLTNQVLLTLFMGMMFILLPFLMLDSRADPAGGAAPVPAPKIERPATPKAPGTGAPASSSNEDDSGSALSPRECEIA